MSGNGKAVKVAICLASTDFVHAFFAYDYARLLAYSVAQMPNANFGPLVATGSLIPQQRETLIDSALERGYTHVLFVDSDMRFPKDALLRLLAHNLPVVGAGYTERHQPFRPLVYKNLETDERLYTTQQHEGTERVAALGFGCLLLQRGAIEKIERPRFTVGWNPTLGRHVGEDIFFCHKAGTAGVPIYVDHDLTQEVTHIGLYEFTSETAVRARDIIPEIHEDIAPTKPLLEVVS